MEFALLPGWFWAGLSFVLGATIGSFLNVCIYRLPREESIVFPTSHCPKCQEPIAPYDNIPVLSYLLLGGKCRHCQQPISKQYPLIEALNGLVYTLIFLRFGLSWETPVYFIFASAMIVVAVIDYYHQIIPNEISVGGIPLGLLAAIFLLPLDWKDAVLGLFIGSGILLAFAMFWLFVFKIEGMGMGDVKLMATVGAFLGWKLALFVIIFGSLLGSIVGLALMSVSGKDLKTRIPFGSFLAPAAIIAIFIGDFIIHWYLGFLQPN